MKIFCEITAPDLDPYPERTLFDQLVSLCPEARSGALFKARLSPDDERIERIVGFLRSLGKEPKTMQVGALAPSQFHMFHRRVYDQSDYEAAELLIPIPEIAFYKTSLRLPDGTMSVGTGELRAKFGLASVFGGLVVSDVTRQQMIEEKLAGLVFKPVAITGRKQQQWEGQVWELTSDVVLPRLAPCCRFVDVRGQPFNGDLERLGLLSEEFLRLNGGSGDLEHGLALDESPYTPAELHYLRSSHSKMPPFDLARTHEVFGYRKGWNRGRVASKRFYEFCLKYKIPMKWTPVRIDLD